MALPAKVLVLRLDPHCSMPRLLAMALSLFTVWGVYARARSRRTPSPRRVTRLSEDTRRRRHGAVPLDRTLLRRLVQLLRVCFPRFLSMETGLAWLLTLLLALRIAITLRMARSVGDISASLIGRRMRPFLFHLLDSLFWSLPRAVSGVGVGYVIAQLERRFHARLQTALHAEYFAGNTLYALATSGRVDNPAHRVTEDAEQFCVALARFLPSVLRPLMDIGVFSLTLSRLGGRLAPLLALLYYALVAAVMRVLHPGFATLFAMSREKEGNLRMMHTQLVQHAEEVAFYRGAAVECENANRLLKSFLRVERYIKRVKWWDALLTNFLVLDGATCVGYVVCGTVVHHARTHLAAPALLRLYAESTELYFPLAKSLGRLLRLGLKFSALCSSAHRLGELRDAMAAFARPAPRAVRETDGACVAFQRAAALAPSGRVVLRDLTVSFRAGRHVLVVGCNGAGKTTLLRVVAGLWPLAGGVLERPARRRLLFLTQRVYLPPGTLRTQLTYPDLREDGAGDAALLELANAVGLGGLIAREGGLHAEKDWGEILSGGERQRVALVRVLHHQPAFAFLDECTSAVSQDTEPLLYATLQRGGTTLVTVSHREGLRSCHADILEFNGTGGYTFRPSEGMRRVSSLLTTEA